MDFPMFLNFKLSHFCPIAEIIGPQYSILTIKQPLPHKNAHKWSHQPYSVVVDLVSPSQPGASSMNQSSISLADHFVYVINCSAHTVPIVSSVHWRGTIMYTAPFIVLSLQHPADFNNSDAGQETKVLPKYNIFSKGNGKNAPQKNAPCPDMVLGYNKAGLYKSPLYQISNTVGLR